MSEKVGKSPADKLMYRPVAPGALPRVAADFEVASTPDALVVAHGAEQRVRRWVACWTV